MACSPSPGVSKVHRISKPSMNVFGFFFFVFPLHRKLNTKIASKESKRVVKQKIKKKKSQQQQKIQVSPHCLFRAN